MEHKQETIETGKRYPTRSLLAQAAYTGKLIGRDLQLFLDYGFNQNLFTEFEKLHAEVAEDEGKQESAKGNIPVSCNHMSEQLHNTRNWIKKAQLKAKRGLRYEDESLKEFNFHMVKWDSTPRVLEILPRFIELHTKYDAILREHGGGVPFAEEGKQLLQALLDMEGDHEMTRKSLPAATRELYYNRGRLYNMICDINAMAQEVFINDPAMLNEYTIDILKRGGAKHKTEDEDGAPVTEASGQADGA